MNLPYADISDDTIVALSTPGGSGAIAIVRLSGPEALSIASGVFSGRALLAQSASHTAHYGTVNDGEDILDEVVATVFRAPNSYTGQDVVEISCHGSLFIQQSLIELFIRRGARLATPGEFTKRAFLSGRMDLSQAEAVADLIASESRAAHTTAIGQMRGGYSRRIKELREQLLEFTSLIELELDFSDQDVEFADRIRLQDHLQALSNTLKELSDSFSLGNAIKNGVPVVIAGPPNAGKSTLLNALLGEEKAIVSPIPGTTRDTIEDSIVISGIRFRFIDTAGLRSTEDFIEKIGVERAYRKIEEAAIIIFLLDASDFTEGNIRMPKDFRSRYPDKKIVLAFNKSDRSFRDFSAYPPGALQISAKTGTGLDALRDRLMEYVSLDSLSDRTVVTNARHYDALLRAQDSLRVVEEGLFTGLSGDLLSVDLRQAISCLSEITGDITDDDILGVIFSKFCIGK